MNEHKDEILLPVLDSDATAVPRYNIIGPDGKVLYKNVSLKLMNGIAQEGTPINKPLLDEFLAAAGVTAGTATAYTLVQKGYSLFDGAEVRFRLHRASGSGATLNVNGTGAKPLRDAMGESMASGMPAGTWLKAIYSAATGAYTISGGAGGGSNENLADNWYFGDPVNSRGRTEYNFSNEYTIDRWKGLNKGVLTIGDEELTLISALNYSGYFRQYLGADIAKKLAGQKITFSALVKGYGRAHLFADPGVGGYNGYKQYDNWDIIALTYTVPADCTNIFFGLDTPNDNTSVMQIKAVKLELGNTSTLVRKDADGNWILNDPPPDKGMELLKCIQSTADPADAYANNVIIHTGNKNLITPADIGAVNKAGDTMTGNMRIKKDTPIVYVTDTASGREGRMQYGAELMWLQNLSDTTHFAAIMLGKETSNMANLLRVQQKNGDATNTYSVIHEGNINRIDIGSITETQARQFVTAAEKAAWNAGGNGSAKVLTDVRLTSNTPSVSITLPTDYNYFRIVISDITATTSATVKVDCNAATRRHEGIWLFDIMENNEPGIAGIATERYNRLIDVAVPDAESMASITMDAHRTPSGMQGQAIAVASDGDDEGTGEINIGTWYADQNNLTEITVSVSSGYMRAGTGIMVVGVK